MSQPAAFHCLFLEQCAASEDGFSTPEVHVVGCHVSQGLVIAPAVVVGDEGRDFALDFIGRFPHDLVDLFFQ